MMQGCVEEEGGEDTGWRYPSLREVAVRGGDIAFDKKCEIEKYETDVREREEGVSERKAGKKGEGVYGDMGNEGNDFGREEMVERKEIGMRTGAKIFVCGMRLDERSVYRHGRDLVGECGGRSEGRRVMNEAADTELQWKMEFGLSMALIVSSCAMKWHFEVWRKDVSETMCACSQSSVFLKWSPPKRRMSSMM